MYRFRNTNRLLDSQELENQEIYFSDIDSLNDPMEGIRYIYWEGDNIVWTNFFKHYLLCLENCIILSRLHYDDKSFYPKDINVFMNLDNIKADKHKESIKNIFQDFFLIKDMVKYIDFIATRPNGISQDELQFHLNTIHRLALGTIFNNHNENGINPPIPIAPLLQINTLSNIIDSFKNLNKIDNESVPDVSLAFSIFSHHMKEAQLAIAYNAKAQKNNKLQFIVNDFPNAYLQQVKEITYPDAHIACFMNNCNNPLVWSHYADGHRGVALKFKSNNQTLELNGINGSNKSGLAAGDISLQYKKVLYTNKTPKINFFTSLGSLPVPQIVNQWYRDGLGNESPFLKQTLGSNIEEWRKQYWKVYEQSYLTKIEVWEYENEYRLFLPDIINLRKDKSNRKLKYDFKDLEEIIFGVKTPLAEKVQIIEIIEEKCKLYNRKDFVFSQATFLQSTGDITVSEFNSLKFKFETN